MEAKEVFCRLKKEAACSICIHTVNKPKSLPCLHSFCLECINDLAATKRKEGKTTFDCPVCSETIAIPDGDKFDDFPTSFYLSRLLDILALDNGNAEQQHCKSCEENDPATSFCFQCNNFLCSACLAAHNRLKVTRAHRTASLENLLAGVVKELVQRPVLCEKLHHEQEPLEYYCQDCRICICPKCNPTEHNQHTKLGIRDAAEQHKVEIMQNIEKIKDQVSENERQMNKDEENFEVFEEQVKSSRYKLEAMLSELLRVLKDYERNVMKQLDDLFTTQRQVYSTKRKNNELSLAQMKSSTNHMEAIVARNIAPEIIRLRTVIGHRCEEILEGNKAKVSEIVNVYFVSNEDLCHILRQSGPGRVLLTSFTDPSNCEAQGMGLRKAECGERAEFTIITKDAEGQMCYSENNEINVHIQAERGGDVKAELKNNKDGTLHVTFTPMKHGLHHVMIKINGHVLTGCPWNLHVIPHQYQVTSSFGAGGTGKGKFSELYGVAVSSTGNVAVADCGNGRVQVFSSEGKYLNEFGQEVGFKTFDEPLSVAYINPDQIVATDCSRVLLFKENGEFIKCFGPVDLQSPCGISLTRDGHVLVCELKKVLVLSPDGNTLVQSFRALDCHGELGYAVYHEDQFFVSCSCCTIKVFDVAGNHTRDIGSYGGGDGQFDRPGGIAIDKFNNLVVVDEWNNRLQIFTPEGEFVSAIGAVGKELGQFELPNDVAVSRDGRLYVADYGNCRVQILC